MANKPSVKISERSVKAVRSYHPETLQRKIIITNSILDRLSCKIIEVLTNGQQTYCENFRKISKGSQKLSSPRPFSFEPTDLQNNRGVNLWPTNLLSNFQKDR